MKTTLDAEAFFAVDLRVGRILAARINEKARRPAYVLELDMGEELGHKTSSAQLARDYAAEELLGRLVICVVNLPPLKVAGITSEVLVLASVEPNGRTLLVQPAPHTPPG